MMKIEVNDILTKVVIYFKQREYFMELKPLIVEKAIQTLREHITQHRSYEIKKIPSERDLASSLSISRVSIRTAIKILVDEGLLIQAQGKGTYIAPIKKIQTIHILCPPDIKKEDPFYNKFLVEITSKAAEEEINLFIINSDKIIQTKENIPLITVGIIDEKLLQQLTKIYQKIISIQGFSDYENVMHVHFDDYKVGSDAAEILTKYGHTNIMNLAGPEKFPAALLRKKGFYDHLGRLSILYHEFSTKMNWTGGYTAGDYILDNFSKAERPSAVFAANDWMAAGLMQRLRERGIGVPSDISIIGCDDIPLAVQLVPKLTTFNLNMKLLLDQVFQLLYANREEEALINGKVLISAKFVERESLIKLY